MLSGVGEAGLILAALVGSGAAWQGLREWRRQAARREDRELARRYLRSLIAFRDEFRQLRTNNVAEVETQHPVLLWESRRLRLKNAYRALEVNLVEAEATWGQSLREQEYVLRRLVERWLLATEQRVSAETEVRETPLGGVMLEILERANDVVWSGYLDDELGHELEETVADLEERLRPYFNSRAT